MITLESLQNEISKYQVPSEEGIISWLIKGDPAASNSGWNFFRRCVIGMAHLDESIGMAISVAYDYEQARNLLSLGNNDKSTLISDSEMSSVIQHFLQFEEKDATDFINSNQLLSIIRHYLNISRREFYCLNIDDIHAIDNSFFTEGKIKNNNQLLSSLTLLCQQSDLTRKQLIDGLRGLGVKVSRISTYNHAKTVANNKINAIKVENSRLSDELKQKERLFFEGFIGVLKDSINQSEMFLLSDGALNFKQWLMETIPLLENYVNSPNADINILRTFLQKIINIHGFDYYSTLRKDLCSAANIFKLLWSSKCIEIDNFDKLVTCIRKIIIFSNTKGESISLDYRDKEVDSNDGFITGANYSQEEIKQKMAELSSRFDEILKIEDMEEYIRRCVDLFFDFLLIHPYIDGNGRTARTLLQVMLAKRGVIIPSLFDNDFLRQTSRSIKNYIASGGRNVSYLDNYAIAENLSSYSNDYSYIENYVINRINKFYPKLLPQSNVKQDDVPSVVRENMTDEIGKTLGSFKCEVTPLSDNNRKKRH